MRHRQTGKHFNRSPAHREALFRNLAKAIITHERIVTTQAKAKALRPFIEKLITKAKKAAVILAAAGPDDKTARAQALHLRRAAASDLGPTHGTAVYTKDDEPVVRSAVSKKTGKEISIGVTVLEKLFKEIGPRYVNRPGGYTRIIKQHYRRLGDGGTTAIIELLKADEVKEPKAKKPAAPAPAAPTT